MYENLVFRITWAKIINSVLVSRSSLIFITRQKSRLTMPSADVLFHVTLAPGRPALGKSIRRQAGQKSAKALQNMVDTKVSKWDRTKG